MDLETIEQLAGEYSRRREELSQIVSNMEQDIARIKREYKKVLSVNIAKTAEAHDKLQASIEEGRDLFQKPKSRKFHNIKVGLQKQKGKVVISDEEKTIKRIEDLLPEDQAELLIRITKSVDKQACYNLVAGDLKRLGIQIQDDVDEVLIKPLDVNKIIDALIRDAGKDDEAQAA